MLNIITSTLSSSSTEVWVPVKDFEDLYEISNLGNLRNSRKQIMKIFINNSNYACVKLTRTGTCKHKTIHRLVAEAFIPQPLGHNEVNHIDGCKLNNDLTNLEWVTSSQNKLHAFANGLRTKESCISTLGTKHKSTDSKFHNVSFDKSRNKWIGRIRHEGKTYFQKRFATEEEAALHVNWIIDELGLTDRPKNVL